MTEPRWFAIEDKIFEIGDRKDKPRERGSPGCVETTSVEDGAVAVLASRRSSSRATNCEPTLADPHAVLSTQQN